MSNLLELNPPKSESLIKRWISLAKSLKVGESWTFSLEIPWITTTSSGILISGFTNHVCISSFPDGNTFKIDISTILSSEIFTPVV